MSVELRPCPECLRSEFNLYNDGAGWYLECWPCHHDGPRHDSVEGARIAWNDHCPSERHPCSAWSPDMQECSEASCR